MWPPAIGRVGATLTASRVVRTFAAPKLRTLCTIASKRAAERALSRESDVASHVCELRGTDLFMLAHSGDLDAKREMLRREIVRIEGCEPPGATVKLREINTKTSVQREYRRLPRKLAIGAAYLCGYGCVPLVFYKPLVKMFNATFVTMECPPPSDLDTILETGAWAWNWMEPPLGTISFTLLCLQWAQEQKRKIGVIAMDEEEIAQSIGNLLVQEYPSYNSCVLVCIAAPNHTPRVGPMGVGPVGVGPVGVGISRSLPRARGSKRAR